MIHAYAIEPEVAASWLDPRTFRMVVGHFGLGTPRAMLEIPKFSKWKKAVYGLANTSDDLEHSRLAELFRILGECRVRRIDVAYDGNGPWLENAEREYDRRAFAAIIAIANPRKRSCVLLANDVGDLMNPLWKRTRAKTPTREAGNLAMAVAATLENCSTLHIVDPHFGPENPRHRVVLEELLRVATRPSCPSIDVTIHCRAKSKIGFFEAEAARMAARLPSGVTVSFIRWAKKDSAGERFHNRYLLTDIGGVTFGGGMDAGGKTQTEDINLMDQGQYEKRWGQFARHEVTLDLVDQPSSVQGRQGPGSNTSRPR